MLRALLWDTYHTWIGLGENAFKTGHTKTRKCSEKLVLSHVVRIAFIKKINKHNLYKENNSSTESKRLTSG